jgi:hypothetical protein
LAGLVLRATIAAITSSIVVEGEARPARPASTNPAESTSIRTNRPE